MLKTRNGDIIGTGERFLRLAAVLEMTGLSRSTVYDLVARDEFPKQVPVTPRTVAWRESEVRAWMHERINGNPAGGAKSPGPLRRDAKVEAA